MDENGFSEKDEQRLDMFGARTECQAEIGIPCSECKYRHACFDTVPQKEQDDEIEYYEELIEG